MIRAAIVKDTWLLLRDRGALISLFVLPIVFMLAFGSIFRFGPSGGESRVIAVWAEPGDPRGAAVASALGETPGFVARAHPDAAAVRGAVAREDVTAGLVIPADASAPIELVIDLAAPEQVRGPIQGAVMGAVQRALAPPQAPPGPRVIATSPPGIGRPLAEISSLQIAVPGNAVLFGFFIALTVAMAFVGERKSGTWRRLLAAPVPRWKALLATLVPYYLVGAGQLAFLFGVGALGFGMQVAGSLFALFVLSLAVVYCAVALGLLFAALGSSEKQLGGVASVVLLVMGLLGGCMVPRMLMPEVMQVLGLGVPHGWALEGYYDLLVRQGTGVGDVASPIGALLAFGTGFACLGIALFRFEK